MPLYFCHVFHDKVAPFSVNYVKNYCRNTSTISFGAFCTFVFSTMIYSMKSILSFFSFSLLFSATISAQTITFCTQLTEDEQCKKSIKKITINPDKGAGIFAVVRLLEEVNTTKVLYKLYRYGEDDEEIYMTTLSQDVSPNWKTFWKQIVFTKESGYKIYLYTDAGKLLSSAEISVLEDFGSW